MATVTKQLVYMDSGAFILSFAYDDGNLQIDSITAVNTSERDYTVSATATGTGKNYTIPVSPGTIVQNIPPGAANRLQLSVTPSGKLDGVEWQVF